MRREPNSPNGSEQKSGSHPTTPEKPGSGQNSQKSTPERPHTPQPPAALELRVETEELPFRPVSTPPLPAHRISSSPANKGNSVESMLTAKAFGFFKGNSGIFINKKHEIDYSKKDTDNSDNNPRYLLYSFVEYLDEHGISCVFALPVFEGFNSRHSYYTQILRIPRDNIVNGGEIIFKRNVDSSFEVALWTDKTGTFCSIMYLNLLRICEYPIAELEKLADSSSIPGAKAAIQKLENYSPPLPSGTCISPDAWEALISIHAEHNLATRAADNSMIRGSSALFSQHHSIYQRAAADPGLEIDFSRISEEAIALAQQLIVMAEDDEEVTANQLFSSLRI